MKSLSILVISVLIAPHAFATGWSEPVKLNSFINSGYGEWGTCVSADGQEIYFGSFRSGVMDIYMSTWDGDDWGPAEIVSPGNISTAAYDSDPYIDWDGTTLYFVTERDGTWDIWYSEHDGGWAVAEPIPGSVNTDDYEEFNLCITPDGQTMYFSSSRPGAPGGWNIWASEWTGTEWDEPSPLGSEINSGDGDYAPKLTPDGLFMYFTSGRDGTLDLYVAERNGDSWGNVTKLGSPPNSDTFDFDPSVYVSGTSGALYFVSYREGPDEIWVSEFTGLRIEPTSLGYIKTSFK
ncbi:MAG: PD40 domain-containing protein [Candidatus Coatesbacteria bacterium]|nr:MAG: PD40 domain-containing protein [Candidatus Coatesbacteria bacterium]